MSLYPGSEQEQRAKAVRRQTVKDEPAYYPLCEDISRGLNVVTESGRSICGRETV